MIHCWGVWLFYICSRPAAVLVASVVAVAFAAVVAAAGVEIVAVQVEVKVVVEVTGVDIEHAPDNVVHWGFELARESKKRRLERDV